MELASLLITQDIKSDEYPFVVNRMQSPLTGTVIDNIMMWLTAFLRFMAVILSAEAMSKEEAADLSSHQHDIL